MDPQSSTAASAEQDPQPKTEKQTSLFLTKLPSEIRIKIYHHILPIDTLIDLSTRSRSSTNATPPSQPFTTFLSTCRQIHTEASWELYSRNIFLAGVDTDPDASGTRTQFSDPLVLSLKSIEGLGAPVQRLIIHVWISEGDVGVFARILAALPQITNLVVYVHWHAIKLARLHEEMVNAIRRLPKLETVWLLPWDSETHGEDFVEMLGSGTWELHVSPTAIAEVEFDVVKAYMAAFPGQVGDSILYSKGVKRPQTAPLVTMPAKIREWIFRYLLLSDDMIDLSTAGWHDEHHPGKSLRAHTAQVTGLGLLGTCHQIHDEGATIFYGENYFRTGYIPTAPNKTTSNKPNPNLDAAVEVLEHLSTSTLSQIKNLALEFTWTRHDVRAVGSILSYLPNLSLIFLVAPDDPTIDEDLQSKLSPALNPLHRLSSLWLAIGNAQTLLRTLIAARPNRYIHLGGRNMPLSLKMEAKIKGGETQERSRLSGDMNEWSEEVRRDYEVQLDALMKINCDPHWRWWNEVCRAAREEDEGEGVEVGIPARGKGDWRADE